ncbi:hypothetical protein RJ640_015253 [Escallonia rubra]|uniref:Uncharacterized protein n=1 Tax=Escallonia rubra TaxID=112253 RepID=A0AA88U7C7_9ASTE|nr:hypothetical protein RJ640_015253 [Escallonia rubra]
MMMAETLLTMEGVRVELWCCLPMMMEVGRGAGPVFPEIGNLMVLRTIDLSWNSLNGSLPATIGNLRDLRVLNLQSCRFTGNIPEEISKLTNLASLDIT